MYDVVRTLLAEMDLSLMKLVADSLDDASSIRGIHEGYIISFVNMILIY